MKKSYAFAAVKSLDSENPNGEFEVVLSAATVDRDGEVIEGIASVDESGFRATAGVDPIPRLPRLPRPDRARRPVL